MSITSILNQWKTDPSIGPNISAWQIIPSRIPSYSEIPPEIDPRVKTLLADQGISSLYSHQLKTFQMAKSGKNITLVTGTSSGKTLAYSLPVIDKIYKSKNSRALFLFPTKALAHDQLTFLRRFDSLSAQAYDGDTPKHLRKSIRNNSQLIVSNPDMLHLGILPYHLEWLDFFSHLDFVIVDEIHTYRGVFGSHVANVFRRLKRITNHYGSSPQFILTSATIGNPRELSTQLIDNDVSLISEDSSARGKKHFLIYNPPVVDEKLGLRSSMQGETIRLADDLIKAKFQTILFGRSRRSIEFMVSSLRERMPEFSKSIKSYRSGYLPIQRREIESGLKTGAIRAVTATNALELGVDIGGLDAAILAGYPGSIAGTLQQAGRSGRTEKESLSILVVSSTPLDQYLAHHPEYLFSTNPESGLINPNNLLIALAHLQCALYELPFDDESQFGNFTVNETKELLDILRIGGKAHQSQSTYYWMAEDYPAGSISLRTATIDQIVLQVISSNNKRNNIGYIDRESAYWMVHPGAIYLHEGDSYQVDELNLSKNYALLSQASKDIYTEADRQTSFKITNLIAEKAISGAKKFLGDIKVTSQVTGYKKINWHRYEIISCETLDLPATTLATQGFWITLTEDTEDRLKSEGIWSSSPNDYGPDWENIRKTILSRDQNTCQICEKFSKTSSLHVHHKLPMRSFKSFQEANQINNLVSLCARCHQRAESVVRVNSGINGLGYILHGLAPLLLMCDPGDIGVYTDFQSPFNDHRPIVLLFEHIPGGIGFSKKLYEEEIDLLEKAEELITKCPCDIGCPSCVGPGGEKGSGGKSETLAILNVLNRRITNNSSF
jgi:DEAD/DEAH box helicase domain-containing protein